jgi:hypothetical protein
MNRDTCQYSSAAHHPPRDFIDALSLETVPSGSWGVIVFASPNGEVLSGRRIRFWTNKKPFQQLAANLSKWLEADRRGNAFSKISSGVHFKGTFQNSDSEPNRIWPVGELSVLLRNSRTIAGKDFLSEGFIRSRRWSARSIWLQYPSRGLSTMGCLADIQVSGHPDRGARCKDSLGQRGYRKWL